MDKVDFNKKENAEIDRKLDDTMLSYHWDSLKSSKFADINELITKLKKNPYITDNGLEQYIKHVGTDIYEYYQFIVSLARELKEYGITYGDIHPGNFGRKNGKLVSFDLGQSTGGLEIKKKLEIQEKIIDYNSVCLA